MTRGRSSLDSSSGAESLRRCEERYRALAAATGGILWVTNAHGSIVEGLAALRRFTGQTADEIRRDGWIAALHPDDRSRVAAFWPAAAEAGTLCATQFRLRRYDGEYRRIAFRAAPIVDTGGTFKEWIGIGIDITTHEPSDEELSGLRTQLAKATAALRRRDRRLDLIDRFNATLHACNKPEEGYPLISLTATRLFPRMNGAFALSDRAGRLKTVTQWGSKHLMMSDFAADDCRKLRRGRSLKPSRRAAACRHFTSRPKGASLCLPLAIDADTLGLLHLDGGARLDRNQRSLVARFGDVIRIGLADLRLRERLRIQAIRDPLTGLFNRQYLDETLPRECQLAERRQSPLSVAMLDIDHFKQVNDRYGHEAGDEVLRAVGGLLRTAVRSSDIACRYGGEEFVLVLLDADLRAAESRLEQIRCDVKRMQCIHRGRTLPSIALSAGVSEFPMHGRTPGEILRAADEAMYAAKHAGRDRIVRSESERSALQDVFP